MTTKEMAASFCISRRSAYDHFSEPLYYHEEGPYLLAVDANSDCGKIHLYEFLDAKTFLSNPEKISPIIADGYFITTAIEEMDIENMDHVIKNSQFELLKIVPQTSDCQQLVKKMYRTRPAIASRIFFMSDSGKLSYPLWSRFTR